jgi:Mor family transcriptional regulator
MSKYHLTRFSKGFIEMMAKEKVATDKNITRDHQILSDKEAGKSISQLAIKYSLDRSSICDILRKYKK